MNKNEKIQLDSTLIAVLHRAGKSWRCVAGRVVNGRVQLVDHREFPLGQEGRLDGWLDMHRAARAIVVLPAASVICRTCALPNVAPDQLDAVLRLQAEAHLPGQAPPHRQAMAVLPAAPGETSRSGLVLAWPPSAPIDVPPLSTESGRQITFAPDIAAVAALMNGARTAEPLLWLDRRDGSIALGMAHAGGATFRATRGEQHSVEESDAWIVGVSRVVAETALSVNHGGPFIDSLVQAMRASLAAIGPDQAALMVPAELLSVLNGRLDGPAKDARFWSTFGIPIGVLLATTGPMADLTGMLQSPPVETPSLMKKVVTVLSDRTMSMRVVAICVIALALSPLVISGLRLAVLNWKVPDLNAHRDATAAGEKQLIMYQDLRNSAWSMTKLLGDIACTTPESVDVTLISLQQGQDIRISGRARKKGDRTAGDLLSLMEEQMRDSGVFDEVHWTIDKGDSAGAYEFDLGAKVIAAHLQARYSEERDYGRKTLRERMYPNSGNGASPNSSDVEPVGPVAMLDNAGPPPEADHTEVAVHTPVVDEGEPTRTEPLTFGSVGSRIEGRAANPAGDRDLSGALPPSQSIPEAYTPDQIKALNREESRLRLSELSKAIQIGSISPDEKKRLLDEWKLVRDHMRDLPKDKP